MTRKMALMVRGPTVKIAPVSNTCAEDQTFLENRGPKTILQRASPEGDVVMMNLSCWSGPLMIILSGLPF
jgi:hypothetical protein